MKLPMIKIYTLHIVYNKFEIVQNISFFSVKRARKYFELMNSSDEFEVSLDVGVLKLW